MSYLFLTSNDTIGISLYYAQEVRAMRKKLLALFTVLIMMVTAVFADTTFDLVGGLTGITTPTSIGIGFGTTGNSGGTNSNSFSFQLGVDTETDIFFTEHHGMYAGAGFSINVSRTTVAGYNVDLGYVHKMYFDDFDLLITAGPHVRGEGNSGTFGLSANVYLDFYLTANLFLRGGGGLSMDFVNFGGRTQGLFWMSIEGPYLGIGYSF